MATGKSPKQPKNLSEERLKSVLELSSDWYWEQDKNLRFTLFSGKNMGEAGFNPAALVGKTRWEIPGICVEPGERAALQAKLDARAAFIDHEYDRVGPDGHTRTISASGVPVFGKSGAFGGYRGVAKDITERKREEELLALEHAVNRNLAEADTAAGAVRGAIRAICETEGWECGRYFRADDDAGVLRFSDAWSVPGAGYEAFIEKSRDVTYAPGVGLIGLAWQSGQPVWSTDATKDPRVAQTALARNADTHGAFIFPVVAEGKVMGALVFSSLKVREPDERLLQAVQVIGSQIGQFLRRIEAQDRLRTNEARMRSLSELSSDVYWEQDEHYSFTSFTGKRTERVSSGHSILLGSKRWEQPYINMTAADWPAHVALLDSRQPFYDLELCRLDEDGRKSWLSVSGEPVFDPPGVFKGYRGVGKDITERKRAEELRTLEHAVNRSLAESDSIAGALKAAIRAICETQGWECGRYFRVDEKAGLLRFAEGWSVPVEAIERFVTGSRKVTYAPGVGLAGLSWQSGQTVWSSDIANDPRVAQVKLARDTGMHGAFIFPVLSDGKVIGVFTFNSSQVREPEERLVQATRVIGSQIGQFVQRKEAEDEQFRFRAAMDASADMITLVDRKTLRYVDMNASACEMHGYSREEMLEKGPLDFSAQTKEQLERSYDETIASGKTTLIESYQHRKDGTRVPVEILRRAVRSGDRWIVVAIVRDISERKRSEELQSLEHAVTRALAEAEGVAGALKAVMRVVCETLSWECGRYFRKDEAAGVFRFAESWYISSPESDAFIKYSADRTFAPGVGVVGKAGAGEPQWVANIADDPRVVHQMMASDHGMRGAFMFPVISDGDVLGVLSFTSREIREPDARLLQAVRVIGSQIGQYVQRMQGEDGLRESEERFRSLTELSSDMYWEQDEQFRFTSMSGTGSQRVNVKTFPALGKKRWEQHYTNMTADGWAGHIALLEAHQPFRDMELCRLDETGKKIWISIGGEAVFDATRAFRGYRGVGKDITARKQDEERIQFLANHDALTSLPNRVMFSEVLGLAIQNARRYNRNFAVLFIDLDRFKNINDTLGHDAGDKLLQEMGTRLAHTVRASDVVARLGGDEFVVLVQEVAEPKQVAAVARKILAALVQPIMIQGQECRVTASIGICMYPSEGHNEQSLMKNADIAMYRAKEDGKNNYKFYSEEINVHSFERLAMETSLRRGLERKEFFLHYQAKVDLRTQRITGVEALIRWQHPDLGVVPPVQFIPLAEETGLIVPMGKWVLNTACEQNVAWQREGLPPLCMAVNLSARQFADEDLLKDIAEALRTSGMNPNLLELELTESMVIQNAERAGRVLAEIKKMGARLAIDDFGVGYSSLTHLKRFPIDTLKVDRSFIRDLPQDAEDRAITEAIIAMGKSLKLTVVAEGVETLEQQAFLKDHNCDEMQGFLFSKPIPSGEFAALLRERIQSSKQ